MAETSSFEDEILALNPEYDLVFSKYNETPINDSPSALERNTRRSFLHRMKIISKMNEIINAKPISELPTQQSAEMETITLMRTLGLEQSVDRALDENRTISTVPTSEDVIFMINGRKKMCIFMSDAYFELKPRSEPSFDLDEDIAVPEDSITSDFLDDVNLYKPIFESSQETESTSLSEEPENKSRKSRKEYNNLDYEVSPDSIKRKSIESQRKYNPQYVDNRRIYTRDSNSDCSSSSSCSSNIRRRGWRPLSGSFSDVRDEKNWRLSVTKAKEPKKQISEKNNDQKILNRIVTLSEETPKSIDASKEPLKSYVQAEGPFSEEEGDDDTTDFSLRERN